MTQANIYARNLAVEFDMIGLQVLRHFFPSVLDPSPSRSFSGCYDLRDAFLFFNLCCSNCCLVSTCPLSAVRCCVTARKCRCLCPPWWQAISPLALNFCTAAHSSSGSSWAFIKLSHLAYVLSPDSKLVEFRSFCTIFIQHVAFATCIYVSACVFKSYLLWSYLFFLLFRDCGLGFGVVV